MNSTAELSKLYISDSNVRKTDRALDIEPLADDIAAHGLIEPLVVVDEGAGRRKYGVIAGGRRLLALQLLEQRGWPTKRIDRLAIPITVRPAEESREISLSENIHKVAMNAADEVEAFAAIVDDYEARGEQDPAVRIARCALHFGKTERYVEQRLRLAGLAPVILAALRSGAISLDVARAYAAVADQQLQSEIFVAQDRQGQHSVNAIRAAYAGRFYRAGDRQVVYVGRDVYAAAGGRTDRDLFMGSELEEILLDTALVDRLARDKGDAEAQRLALAEGYAGSVLKGWGAAAWLRPKTPDSFQVVYSLARLRPDERAGVLAIAAVAPDGASVFLTDEGFVPASAPIDGKAAPAGGPSGSILSALTPSAAVAPTSTPAAQESEIVRLGRIRREKIEATALRLALPSFEGTPLAGRIFMAAADQRVLAPVIETEESVDVAIYVRIPKAELALWMEEAEKRVDHELEGKGTPPPPAPAAAGREPMFEESAA